MKQNPTDDELRSYLLGELPEPQAAALEERILKDDELFDLVEGLEADLLDAASRGELAPAERERVLERLAFSPEGRGRLALARSLNQVADETLPRVVPFRPRIASPKPVLRWAALAAAGLIAAVGFFWLKDDRGGSVAPPIVAERQAPASSVPPVPQKPAPPDVSAPSAPEPSPTPDRLARESTEASPTTPPEPVKAVFTLALTSLRSEGEEVEKLPLPSSAEVAEIRVYFLEPVGSGPFDAAVRSKDRGTIWEGRGLKTQMLDQEKVLVLDIPTKHLQPGRYEVAVTRSSEAMEMVQELDIVQNEDR